MGGFIVLESSHDGVFGWWNCEGFVESGSFEHFLASVKVVQISLERNIMVDRLNLILEVLGWTVLIPTQAIFLVHQLIIDMCD